MSCCVIIADGTALDIQKWQNHLFVQMPALVRAYYEASFRDLAAGDEVVLGHPSLRSERDLDQGQRNVWITEFHILRPAPPPWKSGFCLNIQEWVDGDVISPFSKVVIVVEFEGIRKFVCGVITLR